MHCVVSRLGLFFHGFLFGFKSFFRWFAILILHWFNDEEPTLFAAMLWLHRAQMAVEGAVGLSMADWGVTLVFRYLGRSYIPVFQIRMEKMKEVKHPPL
ncbi:hypothetical protein B296_00048311 [Ensete ventricosum]|uniref:Uncharacterized protein n=1 Tax=Ensete ventricosum TaxID=4639 RepID=A0A426Y6H2_ENSVE|nr:hypothetical protein B296_00048311 [Ensete ventricosum]